VKVARQGVTAIRVGGIPYIAIQARFIGTCGNLDSPAQYNQELRIERPWIQTVAGIDHDAAFVATRIATVGSVATPFSS